MQWRFIPYLFVLAWTVAAPLSATAEDETAPSAISIRWENDTFGGTDANYTNGMSVALTTAGKGVLGGIWDLRGVASGRKTTVYELTQLQFTPTDLTLDPPDPNDRPYAGLTYLSCITHLQQAESLQSLKLLAGFVGPASGAEEAQQIAHRVLGRTSPKGWAHQLRGETVINFLYEYRHKFELAPRSGGLGIELIPMGGAFLGNYLVQAQTEALFRIGYQLPDDFGATSLRGIGYLPLPQGESPSWGINAFVRGGANLVLHNLTLDGNTFVNSKSVDRRLLVPALEFGTALWTRWFMTTLSYQLWGREFAGQPSREGYGSILLSVLY